MAGGIYELRNFFHVCRRAVDRLQKFGNAANTKNKYKALQTRMFAIAYREKAFLSSHIVGTSDDGLLLRTPH